VAGEILRGIRAVRAVRMTPARAGGVYPFPFPLAVAENVRRPAPLRIGAVAGGLHEFRKLPVGGLSVGNEIRGERCRAWRIGGMAFGTHFVFPARDGHELMVVLP